MAFVVLAAPKGKPARAVTPLCYAVYLELLFIGALPFGIAAGQWGNPAVPIMVSDSPLIAVALIAVPAFGLLLYALRFGTPFGLERLRGARGTIASVLAPALAWTALDFIRVKLDPGGLWGPLFLSQAGSPSAGAAAFGGPWLLTFAIVAFNYTIALTLVGASVSSRSIRGVAPRIAAVAGLAAVLAALAAAAPGRSGSGSLTVAAIQPGYDTAEDGRAQLRRWEPGTYGLAALDLVDDLRPLTEEATARGAQLVVWPEASLYVDPRERPRVMRELREVAATSGAALVVPFFDRRRAMSASVALMVDGRVSEAQRKRRPMWFLGERGLEGADARVADLASVELASLLGIDTGDPLTASEAAAAGATLISSSTHDWHELAPAQRAFTAIAARSTGIPMVRADWRFGSAIYSADGTRLADAGTDLRRTVITAEVTPGVTTPYVRLAGAVGWFAVAGSAAAWLAGRRLRALGTEPTHHNNVGL
jgi:apolipoprotein N-acyltransferase